MEQQCVALQRRVARLLAAGEQQPALAPLLLPLQQLVASFLLLPLLGGGPLGGGPPGGLDGRLHTKRWWRKGARVLSDSALPGQGGWPVAAPNWKPPCKLAFSGGIGSRRAVIVM